MRVQRRKRPAPAACCARLEASLDPRLFAALSDPTRLRVLLNLLRCAAPCSVGAAAECCDVDLSVVSRHLASLARVGIVSSRRDGRTVLYNVEYTTVSRSLRALADAIDACCPPESSKEHR